MRWLIREWPYAALLTAGFLLVLAPFFWTFGLPLFLIYLQLPIYMVHQFEEHDRDRFRLYVNQVLCKGREVFTPQAIFIVNSAGVWGVDLLAFYLAFYFHPSYGLVAIYLPLVNGIGHLIQGVAMRRYNPGLWTGLFLFLPIGAWALAEVSPGASWRAQAAGLAGAILIHALILIHVKRRLQKLAA